MPSFARLAVAVTVAFALVSSSALAVIDVEGNDVTFAWTPSSGPVVYYSVYLDKNGEGFTNAVAAYVSEPRVTIPGQFGERIRICVIAWGWDGSSLFSSVPSLASEEVRFVGPVSGGENSSPPPPIPPVGTGAMPYDFNGDGRTDLLWRNRQTNALAVWFMNGTSPPAIVDLGTLGVNRLLVGSGDFDGDGRADLLVRSDSAYELWFMNGDQVHKTGPLLAYDSFYWTIEAVGDFDGDGYADLLWQWWGTTIGVSFMRGAATIRTDSGPFTGGSYSSGTCTPDLNGDGMSDQVRGDDSGTAVWLMDGASLLRAGATGRQMGAARVLGCGDADGDGFGDLLWYDPNSRRGTLWTMDGDVGVDQSFELPQLEAGWTMEAAGDFDGDGRANDILVRNETSGRIEIWVLAWNGQLTGFSVVSTGGAGMGNKDWQVVAP